MDILQAMHDQIVFVEKSSKAVKTNRLGALSEEFVILHDELEGDVDADLFIKQVQDEIAIMEAAAKQEWTDKKEQETPKQTVEIAALSAVSHEFC